MKRLTGNKFNEISISTYILDTFLNCVLVLYYIFSTPKIKFFPTGILNISLQLSEEGTRGLWFAAGIDQTYVKVYFICRAVVACCLLLLLVFYNQLYFSQATLPEKLLTNTQQFSSSPSPRDVFHWIIGFVPIFSLPALLTGSNV